MWLITQYTGPCECCRLFLLSTIVSFQLQWLHQRPARRRFYIWRLCTTTLERTRHRWDRGLMKIHSSSLWWQSALLLFHWQLSDVSVCGFDKCYKYESNRGVSASQISAESLPTRRLIGFAGYLCDIILYICNRICSSFPPFPTPLPPSHYPQLFVCIAVHVRVCIYERWSVAHHGTL